MKTIYFYGDSNTYGFDPADYKHGRYNEKDIWTSIVEGALRRKFSFTIDGMNGRCIPSSGWIIERINSIQTDIFAVMLGTNDYLQMPDTGYVAERMHRFLSALHHKTILLCAPVGVKIPGEPMLDTEDGRLSGELRKVAEELGCDFINTLEWGCSLAFDGVHLSREGHLLFGQRMTEFLREKYDLEHYQEEK
ncbi:MAG: lipase [Lachnospiraceae bacterium]|nr:lipase [Lachnospiraceae bacterium]